MSKCRWFPSYLRKIQKCISTTHSFRRGIQRHAYRQEPSWFNGVPTSLATLAWKGFSVSAWMPTSAKHLPYRKTPFTLRNFQIILRNISATATSLVAHWTVFQEMLLTLQVSVSLTFARFQLVLSGCKTSSFIKRFTWPLASLREVII